MRNQNLVFLKFFFLMVFLTFFACHPAIKKETQIFEETLEPVEYFYPTFTDDMNWESLVSALKNNQGYLNKLDPERLFHYGPHTFTCREVKESQETFLNLIRENPNPARLEKAIQENFLVYRATGHDGDDQVLFTGYFEPLYDASLTPDDTFKYPLYKKPENLITANLSLFKKNLKGQTRRS